MNYRTLTSVGALALGLSLTLSSPWSLAQNTDTPNAGAPNGTPNAPRRFRQGTPPGGPGGNRGNRGARMAEALNLSPEARTKFEAEMQTYEAEVQKLRDAHLKRVEAFLTPQQAEQYRNMSQRGPGGRGGGFGGPGGGGGRGFGGGGGGRGIGRMDPQQMLQQMKTDLSLTATQETQIGKILNDSQAAMEKLRSSMQDPNADRDAMRQQMRALRQDQQSKISTVLTPEQRTKWEASRQNRGGGFGGRGGGRGGRRGGPGGGGPGGADTSNAL